jgi:hypothetical protein
MFHVEHFCDIKAKRRNMRKGRSALRSYFLLIICWLLALGSWPLIFS